MKILLNHFKTQSLSNQITLLAKIALVLVLGLQLTACTTDLKMKVSGHLNTLSENQTVAILPIEVVNEGQEETAELFRQSLYANLLQSDFHLMEHYIVDELLSRNGLTDPQKFRSLNPMHLGEILGVDATQPVDPVPSGLHLEAVALEPPSEEIAVLRIVVDDQNSGRLFLGFRSRLARPRRCRIVGLAARKGTLGRVRGPGPRAAGAPLKAC